MKAFLTALIIFFGLNTFAQEDHNPGDGHEHTKNVCSTKNPNICAHIMFLKHLNTKEEGEFILHIATPNSQEVTDLKVKLWMEMGSHGHEGAPVEIQPMGNLHYKIQNAWFVMEGEWQVKVQFNFNNETHMLSIPVQVTAGTSTRIQSQEISNIRKELFEKTVNCDQTVSSNEKYLAVGIKQNPDKTASVKIQSLTNPNDIFTLPTKNRVVDIKLINDTAYVLTETTFLIWDIKTKVMVNAFNSYPNISPDIHWRQKASGFIIKGDNVFITHGTLGISVLNIKTGDFTNTIKMPTVSAAQDIDFINDKQAVIAVDNDQEGSFCGLYIFDLELQKIIKQIKIDNAFPSSVRVLSGNRLMMVYFNAIWKFDLNATVKSDVAEPNRRSWKFPDLNAVDMQGKVFFDDKNLYACFSIYDDKTQIFNNVPKAIDLEALKLK